MCDDRWDDVDAGVVCGQLGLDDGATATKRSTFGVIWPFKMWLDDVQCTGSESVLSECPRGYDRYGEHNCGPAEQAGVRCLGPATGAPAISGTARIGHTLTASTAAISDPDGLARVSYSYQWIRVDGGTGTDIMDATGSTYVPVAGDAGKTLKVRVSFTDDAGSEESLTSVATAPLLTATVAAGAPAISGTARIGHTLTVSTAGISDPDGLARVSYSYQWIRVDGGTGSDIMDATGSTYVPVAGDVGKTLKVRVSFTDDADNAEMLISAATAPVPAPIAATGAPAISGTARVGHTLTASTAAISDPDGLARVSYSYRWIRVDSGTGTDIPGATGSTYVPVVGDVGRTLRVKVSFTDDAGYDEALTSAATAPVAAVCRDGEVRLVNGSTSSEGSVQFCHSGTWGAVCDDWWDDVDAGVVCGQLGFEDGGSATKRSTFGVIWPFKMWLDDVQCTGSESVLSECPRGYDRYGEHNCGPAEQAGVRCLGPATGAPTISGTARIGQTLTAWTSAISDSDGLTRVT